MIHRRNVLPYRTSYRRAAQGRIKRGRITHASLSKRFVEVVSVDYLEVCECRTSLRDSGGGRAQKIFHRGEFRDTP